MKILFNNTNDFHKNSVNMFTDCDETAFNSGAEGKGCFWPLSDLNCQGQVVPQCDFQLFKGTLPLCVPPDSRTV